MKKHINAFKSAIAHFCILLFCIFIIWLIVNYLYTKIGCVIILLVSFVSIVEVYKFIDSIVDAIMYLSENNNNDNN